MWTGFIWLSARCTSALFWAQCRAFGFHKRRMSSNSKVILNFCRKTLQLEAIYSAKHYSAAKLIRSRYLSILAFPFRLWIFSGLAQHKLLVLFNRIFLFRKPKFTCQLTPVPSRSTACLWLHVRQIQAQIKFQQFPPSGGELGRVESRSWVRGQVAAITG
jgi:hypothetical protein